MFDHLGSLDWQGLFLDFVACLSLGGLQYFAREIKLGNYWARAMLIIYKNIGNVI